MNKISILGAGWLGLALTKELIKLQLKLKVFTRRTKLKLEIANVEEYCIDTDEPSNEIYAFLSSEVLIVNIPSKNIDSFASLVSKIENSSVEKVLFISFTSVCHNNNSPLLEIENFFTNSTMFETTILRFAGLVGYGRNPAYFFKNKNVVLNAEERVNFIHRDDCINIVKVILEQNVWGEVFNACADTHPTKKEFYTRICQLENVEIPKFTSAKSTKKIISNIELKKVLHYEFIYPDVMNMNFSEKEKCLHTK